MAITPSWSSGPTHPKVMGNGGMILVFLLQLVGKQHHLSEVL